MTLEHIGKRYGIGEPALSDVSLNLEAGGFYVLTGASGAGKTTLLNIIALAEFPTEGRVTLFGSDAGRIDRAARAMLRRRIGIVFQNLGLVDDASAAVNVALPLRIAGVAPREAADSVTELLAWVGLADRADALAGTLSGSERQRIAIARAIIGRPELLLADEPTGNVDGEAALLAARIFERINQLGTTVLVATHDVAFAGQFEHRHLHLDRGQLSAVPLAAGT